MAVEHVEVSRSIDVDPAAQAEEVNLSGGVGTEVIEKGLDMLLHLFVEIADDRLLQVEEIKRVVPTPIIGPPHRITFILH